MRGPVKPKKQTLPKVKKQKAVRAPKEIKESFEEELLQALLNVKNGNFSVRMPHNETGINGKICDVLNEIIESNEKMVNEFTNAEKTIGKEGKLNERIELPNAKGDWKKGVASLNEMISALVHPTIEIAQVISSVAKGNLSHSMPLEVEDHKLKG